MIRTGVLRWLQSVERSHVALDRSATTAGLFAKFYYGFFSSSCVRTYSMVASGGLTFIVVSVVVFIVITGFLVHHFKKGRNFHRRVRSDSNIERLLREAFISDDNVMRMTPVAATSDTMTTTSHNSQRCQPT